MRTQTNKHKITFGKVFFTGKDVQPGEFYSIRITEVLDGDLVGEREAEG